MIPSARRIIFLHGVGSNGAAMRPLAESLALPQPAALPDGLHPFDMGAGRQWFSVKGVTEANRPDRIAEALPAFARLIESLGEPRDSLLIGFSQGAIMALHAVAAGLPVAGVIALSGRLAGPVAPRDHWPPIRLIHGADDPVMPLDVARRTEAWLQEAGAAPRLTVFDGLGHTIDARVLAAIHDTLSQSGEESTRISL